MIDSSVQRPRGCGSLGRFARVTLFLTVIAALAVPVEFVVVAPASASPPQQCFSPHCYDVSVVPGNFSGVEDQWTDESLFIPASEVNASDTVPPPGNGLYHFSEEMWLNTNQSTGQWVEEGLAQACDVNIYSSSETFIGQSCPNARGKPAYEQFWADTNKSGAFFFHLIDTLTPDSINHVYQIWNYSNGTSNNYAVYLDFNQVGTSTVQTTSSGYSINSGFELYSPAINRNEYSGLFNQYLNDYVNGIGWQSPHISSWIVNDPCEPSNPASNGQCFNAQLYHPYEWSDSKPSS